jgi:hypothetical protein
MRRLDVRHPTPQSVRQSKPDRLAIIGAGPKALAIAAKRKVLSDAGWAVPELIVIEKDKVGGHWFGASGFTDGSMALGTPPEKDLGFPYSSACWGLDNGRINASMQGFSWQSYLIGKGDFAEWVDRGKLAPRHGDWARYLKWAWDQCECEVVPARLTRIDLREDAWRLSSVTRSGTRIRTQAEGLVITGPGQPLALPGQRRDDTRISNGRDFWIRPSKFRVRKRDPQVCIIGTGETAAAIAAKLISLNGPHFPVDIVNPHGAIFSRGESYFENYRFSNPSDWLSLTKGDRQEFVNRTDRGVFSPHALSVIGAAASIDVVKGRVRKLESRPYELRVYLEYGGRTEERQYQRAIVALGFDSLWFWPLLSRQAKDHITDGKLPMGRERLVTILSQAIRPDLSIRRPGPRLHVPMLSAISQGPGFPNLSSLGLLADRILLPYVVPGIARLNEGG